MFSVQCLQLGLHGYLIRSTPGQNVLSFILFQFAPLAFIPYCQNCPREVPSLLLVQPRSTHFTATLVVLLTSSSL